MGDHRADRRSSARAFAQTTSPADHPTVSQRPGRRRAAKPSASRGTPFRNLISSPAALGSIALLAATAGTVTTVGEEVGPDSVSMSATSFRSDAAVSVGASSVARRAIVSRSERRVAPRSTDQELLLAAAERMSQARNAALARLTKLAKTYSTELELNKWYLPVDYVALTARYGEYGLWANSHTGLDFNGDEGDPIYAVANGVVTSTSYDGAYGNKTVLTLEDGTEIWYCHQSRYLVSVGDEVRGGEQIGAIGSTGNVTGSHLHLEVRPGGGGPTDPYSALASNDLF